MQINPIAGPSQADYTQVTENIRRMHNGRARTPSSVQIAPGSKSQMDPILPASELPDGLLPRDGMRAPFYAERVSSQGAPYLMRIWYA